MTAGKVINKEDFLEYVRAFNAQDFEKQYSFYHDEVTLDIPDPQTGLLKSKDGIRSHYLPLFKVCDEVIVPQVVMVEDDQIFYIMESYFRYDRQLEKGVFNYRVEEGDVVKIRVWAYYTVRDGKFDSIVCNLFKSWFLGKIDLKEAVRESESRAPEDIRVFNY